MWFLEKSNHEKVTSKQTRKKQERTIDYFSRLNLKQLDDLYNMYKIDFEIFGYAEYPYVNRTRK